MNKEKVSPVKNAIGKFMGSPAAWLLVPGAAFVATLLTQQIPSVARYNAIQERCTAEYLRQENIRPSATRRD